MRPSKTTADEISRKKEKFLRRPFFANNIEEVPLELKSQMKHSIIDGVSVQARSAQFSQVDGKSYLKKPHFSKEGSETFQEIEPISLIFSNNILRILSAKTYTTRGAYLQKSPDGQIEAFLSKWDFNIDKELPFKNFRRPYYSLSLEKDQYFLKSHARLLGVLAVIAEFDFSPTNFRKKSDGKTVKIDDLAFINGSLLPENSYQRVMGCALSNDFLHIFLAGKKKLSCVDEVSYDYEKLKSKDKEKKTKLFNKKYNQGIDENLLQEIKSNITRDKRLEFYFIEFMQGLDDAIELVNDENFFDKYLEKYEKELGEDGQKKALQLFQFYQENAKKANEIYQKAGFFDYAKEILSREKSPDLLKPKPPESRRPEGKPQDPRIKRFLGLQNQSQINQ